MPKYFKPIIQFLGATGTVTGSKTALLAGHDPDDRLIVDCGLFQGLKELRLRNWSAFPLDPASIGTVLLTHGHLDHCGYLPRLVKNGFSGKIYCTRATAKIAEIILMDSAHLQEEEADYANRKGFSKHSPALPLYTSQDARRAIDLFQPVTKEKPFTIGSKFTVTFHEAGHILGSSSIQVNLKKDKDSILFSGDLGRYGAPIFPNPASYNEIDWVIMESTYGDRLHQDADAFATLADVVNSAMRRGGVLVIPAFAVGRTQLLLYALRQLKALKAIDDIPIYIDSPMAIKVTETHNDFEETFDTESRYLVDTGEQPLAPPNLHVYQSVEQSKSLNQLKNNAIIISASGMATGGRILHHLVNRLPEKENTILFIGYQAVGTRGRTILDGEPRVKIHGQMVPIKASIESIDGFSSHADRDELIIWLKKFDRSPRRIFLNHGESDALIALQETILDEFKTTVTIPDYLESFECFPGTNTRG